MLILLYPVYELVILPKNFLCQVEKQGPNCIASLILISSMITHMISVYRILQAGKPRWHLAGP